MLSRTATVAMITLASAVAAMASVSVAQAGMIGNANFAGSKTVSIRPTPMPPRVQTQRADDQFEPQAALP